MSSRRLLTWLFALALMFGQATAFAHALTHLKTHDTPLPDKVCEVCVAHAQLSGTAPPAALALAILLGTSTLPASAVPLCVDLVPAPASARDPPCSDQSLNSSLR